MKGFVHVGDFDAVTYDGCVYCIECIPDGISLDSEEVAPIFASEELDRYPVCDECSKKHVYMGLTCSGVIHELVLPSLEDGDQLDQLKHDLVEASADAIADGQSEVYVRYELGIGSDVDPPDVRWHVDLHRLRKQDQGAVVSAKVPTWRQISQLKEQLERGRK